jgi:hypothetical protein
MVSHDSLHQYCLAQSDVIVSLYKKGITLAFNGILAQVSGYLVPEGSPSLAP